MELLNEFKILLLFYSMYWKTGTALHCFSHDHCGKHAVCVGGNLGETPTCMCILGFVGNGARCERLSELAHNTTSKIDQLIIEKTACRPSEKSVASEQADGPPGFEPEDIEKNSPVIKILEEKTSINDEEISSIETTKGPLSSTKGPLVSTILASRANVNVKNVTPPPLKKYLNVDKSKECEKVVCDFDTDACRYRSIGEITWIRKPKKAFSDSDASVTDFVASVKLGENADHYLASENFVLLEEAELRFRYFENDALSHLQVCDNDLSHCSWQSEGVNGKWADAAIVLPAGSHRIIFVATDLGSNRNVAIDDIRLNKNEGEAIPCI